MSARAKLYIIIACLFSIPLIFLILLNYHFNILNYTSPQYKDLKKLLEFAKLIIENIGERKLKTEIWTSIIYSTAPLLIIITIITDGKKSTSHGIARWANKHDILGYKFSFKRLIGDFFRLFSYKNLISIKSLKTNIKNFLQLGFYPHSKFSNININFDDGFVLGIYKDISTTKKVYYNAPQSTFIVAPPGAGKSASVIIPNLLNVKTSCIITDIKGELCDLTAGYRQKVLNNEVYIFNPLGNDNNIKFNPFDRKIVEKLNFNQKKRLVDEVANTIFVPEKNADSHWIESAKNLFIFYALYDLCCFNQSTFFEIARGPKRDYIPLINPNYEFAKTLYQTDDDGNIMYDDRGKAKRNADSDPENIWFKQVSEQKYTNPNLEENFLIEDEQTIEYNVRNKGYERLDDIVRDYARALSVMNDKEFASIKSIFNRTMNIFNSYQVRDATDDMSFEYEDLRRKNITLYIKIAQTDIATLAPLIRILLESIAKNLLTRESKGLDERIYFLLDEFVRFGKLEFLSEMPALCRSYNIVAVYVTQDYAMVEKAYSKEDLRMMNGNIACRILFRMNETESAEAISKEIGNMTRKTRNYSTQSTKFFETGSSISKEGYALITAQDLMNLSNEDVIITATGTKALPLKLKANYYYKDKEYMAIINKYANTFDPILQEEKLKANKNKVDSSDNIEDSKESTINEDIESNKTKEKQCQ